MNTMNEFFTKHYFDCQCGNFDHVYRIVMDNETGELHIELQFKRFGFWRRVRKALQYVFGMHVDYGFYAETLIDPSHYDGLRDVLRASEERAKEYADGFAERIIAEEKALRDLTFEEKQALVVKRAIEIGLAIVTQRFFSLEKAIDVDTIIFLLEREYFFNEGCWYRIMLPTGTIVRAFFNNSSIYINDFVKQV